jgi:hypothetical protein
VFVSYLTWRRRLNVLINKGESLDPHRLHALPLGECLLMAQSGHPTYADECPLSGVKRTWRERTLMSANNPKQTCLGVECQCQHGRRL